MAHPVCYTDTDGNGAGITQMRRWLRKKVWDFLNENVEAVSMRDTRIQSDGTNIIVFNATGGTVIEFRRYDRKKDENCTKMYVISSEQNFGEQLAKIVNLEMMRQ